MIIVCTGDSFTAGAELWEEKNILGYTDIKTPHEALQVANEAYLKFKPDESRRKELTYTKFLENNLSCQVINLGVSGSSEIDSVQRAILQIYELRKKYPLEKIICLLQNTNINRVWLWKNSTKSNKSHILPIAENTTDSLEESYDIKNIFLNHATEQQLYSEYVCCILSLQMMCDRLDVNFLHFNMNENSIIPTTLPGSILYMNSNVLNNTFLKNCIEECMIERFFRFFGDRNFLLPGYHMNCESHEIMGRWIVREMKKRSIV